MTTIRLTAQENGTTATILTGKTQEGPSPIRGLLDFAGRKLFSGTMQDGLNALSEVIEDEITQGKITQQPAVQVPADQIENALVESLAEA